MEEKGAPFCKKGQSTVEFILTLILFFSFFFFHFKLGLILAFGNYVHYATFMAARAGLSDGTNAASQQERSKTVATMMLKRSISMPNVDKFKFIASANSTNFVSDCGVNGLKVKEDDKFEELRAWSWLEGVRYSFSGNLFFISPIGNSNKYGALRGNILTLTSESWLTRDPSEEEVRAYKSNFQNAEFDNDP